MFSLVVHKKLLRYKVRACSLFIAKLLLAGLRAAREKITLFNRLNYCLIFIVYTAFTNVAECRTMDYGLETHALKD